MQYRFFNLLMLLLFSIACGSTNHKVKTHRSSITDRTFESNTRFFATITTRRPFEIENFNKTFVRLHNAIPNNSLIYLINKKADKKTKLFRADWTIDVRFLQKGKFVFNQLFTGFVEKDTFDDTKNNLFYLSTLDILVDPGQYDIEVQYKCDLRKSITKFNNVVVPNYNTVFSIASPHLLHRNGNKEVNGNLVPRFNTNYTNFLTDEDLIFLTELYNVKAGRIDFKFEIFKGDDLKQTSYTHIIVDSADIYEIDFPFIVKVLDLREGEYLLKIKMSDTFNNTATTEVRIFKEEDIVKYSSKKEWKDTIRLLGFIATYPEIKILKKLKTPKERKNGVYNFWKKRDKGENLFIAKSFFYHRVQFVNDRWATRKRPGWKTDFGRIHITYGAPDFKQQVPMNGKMSIFRAKPYEIWTYERIDRIFIFVDSSRTGTDYRLVSVMNRRGDYIGLNEKIRR